MLFFVKEKKVKNKLPNSDPTFIIMKPGTGTNVVISKYYKIVNKNARL